MNLINSLYNGYQIISVIANEFITLSINTGNGVLQGDRQFITTFA